MKNRFKNIKILSIFLFCFFQFTILFGKELNFKASEISTFEEGNLIIGKKDAEAKIDNELEIYADKFTYDKKKETLLAEGNVKAFDLLNKITIDSEKILYNKIKNKIISYNKTNFDIDKKYNIESEDVHFLIEKAIISSNKKTKVIDDLNNKIELSSFRYFDETEILKGKDIKIFDSDSNRYSLKNGMLKLKEYILLGKDIKVFLRKDSFGNPDNEPKLIGNSIYYKDNKTLISKGIFTSCKENDNCPPWSII